MTDIRPIDALTPDPGPTSSTQAVKDEATQVASTAADQGRETASAAAGAASQTAGTAAEGAKQVASEAAQQVTEVRQQATDQARQLVGEAQSQLKEQASSQTQRAASGLADVGRQIRALSEGRSEGAGVAADAARQLADKVEELAGRVEQRGFDGTVEDLRSFARRRPGMFLLSAAATGFVVGRLGRGAQAVQGDSSSTPAPAAGPGAATPQASLVPPAPALGGAEPYVPTTTLPEFEGGS